MGQGLAVGALGQVRGSGARRRCWADAAVRPYTWGRRAEWAARPRWRGRTNENRTASPNTLHVRILTQEAKSVLLRDTAPRDRTW